MQWTKGIVTKPAIIVGSLPRNLPIQPACPHTPLPFLLTPFILHYACPPPSENWPLFWWSDVGGEGETVAATLKLAEPGVYPKARTPHWVTSPTLLGFLYPVSCFVCSAVSDFLQPMDCSPPGSSVHGFSRQEYWSRLLFPTPEDLPNQGIEPTLLASPTQAFRFFTTAPPGEPKSFNSWIAFAAQKLRASRHLQNLAFENGYVGGEYNPGLFLPQTE